MYRENWQAKMKTVFVIWALAALAAVASGCGGGPTGPTGSVGTPALAIVSGTGQRAAPSDTLPADFVVKVTRDGKPVADQLVDWHVVEEHAGDPFVTTTKTAKDGTVRNRVVAGTWAWTRPALGGPAHVEVRWVEQSTGEAIVDTTIAYWVDPGVATDALRGIGFPDRESPFDVAGDLGRPDLVTDQYGNPSLWALQADSLVAVQDSTVLAYESSGCGPIRVTVADTTVQRGYLIVGGYLDTDHGTGVVTFHDNPSDSTISAYFDDTPYADSDNYSARNIYQGCARGVMADGDTIHLGT